MPLAGDDVLAAVRDGRCRRPKLERLGEFRYVVDAAGTVYSLNAEQPRVIEPKTGSGGFEWVCLNTPNGWEQFMVGELVAHAFLLDARPAGDEDWTVAYRDQDTRNHAVENLAWITRLEANRLKPLAPRAREPAPVETTTPEPPTATAEPARAPGEDARVLDLLERLRRQQERHAALQGQYTRLAEALRPFAEFTAGPDPKFAHADTVVAVGRGAGETRTLTVADFQRAADTLRSLEAG
jgi:hypothetical protein